METSDVKKLALIFAIQAEIEGMKAENLERELQGYSMAYTDTDFRMKAKDLRNIAKNSTP